MEVRDEKRNPLAAHDVEQRMMRLAHNLGLVAPRQRSKEDSCDGAFAGRVPAGGEEERLVIVCEDELAAFV